MSEQNQAAAGPSWIADHIHRYLTDPAGAHLWDASLGGSQGLLTTLLLTTKGRKSGGVRHAPLIYQEGGGGYVVVASKGGAPQHPAWYLNLKNEPEVEIRVGPRRMKARARTAQGEERTRLWALMAKAYPPYDDYQRRAGAREIPVVVLEPLDPS